VKGDFFHTNLRAARERAGLSQAELAEEIGVARTTIVYLESGKTQLVSKTVPLIAARLGLSVEELLCGVPQETLIRGDEQVWREREQTLKEEYERRLSALQDKLDTEKRINKVLQANVDSLNASYEYLLQQLRKEQ